MLFASKFNRSASVCVFAAYFALWTGCEPASDPKLLELKNQFVVTEEPASPVTIEVAIASITNQSNAKPSSAEQSSTEQATTEQATAEQAQGGPQAVTIFGRINAGSSDPFDATRATMVLSEVPEAGHDHDPGDCPFCKKRLENAKSCIVRFLDKDGNLIQHSAQQLLGVAKDQEVVVHGPAVYLPEVDVLQIDVSAIYLRPQG